LRRFAQGCAGTAALLAVSAAWAADPAQQHGTGPQAQTAGDQTAAHHGQAPAQHGTHGMDMSSMQGGRAPAGARSPDYSEGAMMSPMPGMMESMNDDATLAMLLLDELETVDVDDGVQFDAQAWIGRDAGKLWIKADGEHADGNLDDLRMEALWDRPWMAFWDTQLGVRQDFGEGPDRTWIALGVQGLAPYWFDIEAAVYAGEGGRTAARFEVEYDLKITQRLIVKPDLEINVYGKDDPGRGIGSGVSNVEFGVRLRYEIRRQVAPYVGVDWNRRVGDTADLARATDDAVRESVVVAGIRLWF
jgi:copper resistance protein B